MPVYCEQATEDCIRRVFHYAFRPGTDQWPPGFVPKLHFLRVEPGVAFEVLGERVLPIRLEHGTSPVLGFRVGSLAYCTDVSRIPDESRADAGGTGRPDPGCPAVSSRTRPTSRLDEALAVVERAEAPADLLDAPVAQLRSWTDAGQAAARVCAGLRRTDAGILREIRWRLTARRAGVVPVGVESICPMSPEPGLVERLDRHGQSHLLRWWGELNEGERARLASEVASIDFDQLDRLIAELVRGEGGAVPAGRSCPADRGRTGCRRPTASAWRSAAPPVVGADAMAAGEVGVILVAGGSGTRLGFEGPKGTFPIGPVSSASLFQIHAEKILALGRRFGEPIPLYIMTSPENHQATVDFFQATSRFGLDHVRFFVQGQMPAVDRATGKVLLASKDHVALSPDGHGGTLAALAPPGPDGTPSCLDEMRECGVRTLFYFQVDNPLVRIADPAFIGLHREADAEMSFKVVERHSPDEKLGVVVRVDGRPQVIEYSDLPAGAGRPPRARGPAGALGRQHRRPHPRAVVHRAAGGRASPAVPPRHQEGSLR